MAAKRNEFTHQLSLPNSTYLPNGLNSDSPPDSLEFYTPNATPEPSPKLNRPDRNWEESTDSVLSRPTILALPPESDTTVPHISTEAPTPVPLDKRLEQIQTVAHFPSRSLSTEGDYSSEQKLTPLSANRGLSATPDPFRKLVHPSQNPFRSRSPSPTDLSRSCENLKTQTLQRRPKLARHKTKETSHIDVCDSEDEYQVNQYIIKEDIGQGAYGQVKKVIDKQTNEVKAMKIISKKILKRKAFQRRGFSRGSRGSRGSQASQSTADEEQGLRKEIAVQKKLDHPCIVRLFEVLDDENKNEIYLVLEYLERGTVMEVGKDGPIPEDKCHSYFVDMLLGVEYLHYQNIIHRDIKPENLLLDDHGRLKIADFGESEDRSGSMDLPGDQPSQRNVGTPAFYAPELTTQATQVSKALDVWAMGVTLYCLLFGQLPFKGDTRQEMYTAIQTQEVTFPQEIETSEEVRDLMDLLLDKSADTRVSLDGVRGHAWTQRAGPLVSPEDNCSEYIEVTEEEVDGAIRSCTTYFSALVLVKMMLQKRSFRVPLLARKNRSATTACDSMDSVESVFQTSSTQLPNQMSELSLSLDIPEADQSGSGARPLGLQRQANLESPCPSSEL